MSRSILTLAASLAAAMVLASCGGDDSAAGDEAGVTVAVTTDVLGDVVEELVGDLAAVETLMPAGADPHTFQPSARQVAVMADAEVLIVNGAGFEEHLLDTIEGAAAHVPRFEAISAVEPLPLRDVDHGEQDHGGGAVDPHFFNDPSRMHDAATAIADFLADQVPDIDSEAYRARVDAYLGELVALDREVRDLLAPIPAEDRILVTDHEVFGYFADRYDFEILGVVVPGGSTNEGVSGATLADLVRIVEDHQVPAVFTSAASPDVVETLAGEAGVAVVELFTESLGPEGSGGARYLGMQRTNAERIAAALDRGRE